MNFHENEIISNVYSLFIFHFFLQYLYGFLWYNYNTYIDIYIFYAIMYKRGMSGNEENNCNLIAYGADYLYDPDCQRRRDVKRPDRRSARPLVLLRLRSHEPRPQQIHKND